MTTAKQSGRRDEWSHGNYSAASISGDTDDLHSRLHFRRLQICATIFFGLLVGVLHYYHVGTLYENDRYFSHLSNLEREMCFRSEMGLYYSFYKRLTLSSSLRDGVTALIRDNTTEFPDTINALSKFNIYPEIFTAGVFNLYQHFLYVMDWSGKECYTIQRGNGLSPIESCVGLGEPVYFYLEVVWIFAGLVAFLLFFYGTLISGSILGGCVTILCFAINHAECTRVQWTPPLRESFAYPMILLHCLMVTSILQQNPRKQATGQTFFWKEFLVFLSTLASLLFWQLAIFILTCELAILTFMFSLELINRTVFQSILIWSSMGYLLALVGLMGNQLVLFSFLTAVLISAWLLLVYYHKFNQRTFMCRSLIRIVLVTTVSMLLKMSFPFTGNDSHIIKIFLSKVFGNVKDFHTLMYTCAPEFQGLPWSYGLNLTISLLIPLLTIVFLIISTSLLRELSNLKLTKNQRALQTLLHKSNHPSILFNISLLLIYFLLSMMAMRLKLFLSPQLCILVSLICSEKIARLIPFVRERTKWQYPLLFAIVAVLSFHSLYSIKKQHNVLGEYYNEPLEELLSWTKTKTNEKDVFAGPMPVMANILLSTGRPIVNHPYYEDEKNRVRTVLAYSVFSRKSAYEAFEALTFLKANYVVLEASKCFDSPNSRKECKMTDLWDLEDPKNSERPPLCPQLFYGDESPFLRVFQNEEYVVLSIRSA